MAPGCILVTGASGFVGRHLLPQLRVAFPAARLLAATRGAALPLADATIPFDLLDPAGIAAMLAEHLPDVVLHLAAQADVGASFQDPAACWRANVDGTLALARALPPETLLVHASSAEVYGLTFQRGQPLAEDAPMAPANPYAAAKAAADLALGEMALRGLRLVRLRAFNQVGPGQGPGFVVAAFARQIARVEAGLQPPELRVGALDRWRDFLDVRDVAASFVAAVQQAASLPPGGALNIASGTPRRVGDVLAALLARSAARITVVPEAARLRPTDVAWVAGDASLARRLLGWAPRQDWEQTLDAVLADWRGRIA